MHYNVPSLKLRDPHMFQHGNGPVYKSGFRKPKCAKIAVAELKWPAQNANLNPTEHFWNKLKC